MPAAVVIYPPLIVKIPFCNAAEYPSKEFIQSIKSPIELFPVNVVSDATVFPCASYKVTESWLLLPEYNDNFESLVASTTIDVLECKTVEVL